MPPDSIRGMSNLGHSNMLPRPEGCIVDWKACSEVGAVYFRCLIYLAAYEVRPQAVVSIHLGAKVF